MSPSLVFLAIAALAVFAFFLGQRRVLAQEGTRIRASMHSLPSYYGYYMALWCLVPPAIVMALWAVLEPTVIQHLVLSAMPESYQAMSSNQLTLVMADIRNFAYGNAGTRTPDPAIADAVRNYHGLHETGAWIVSVLGAILGVAGFAVGFWRINPQMRARNRVERFAMVIMLIASTIAVLTTVGIVGSLLFESMRFFTKYPALDFLFGLQWSPQTAIRADQVGSSGAFGFLPLFTGSLLITVIAMLVAVPVGLLSAIYMADYASPRLRSVAKPVLEVLAGIPTVVYGFFAALTVAPFVRDAGTALGLDVASESALAAGVVMGIMIVPFVSSLADDVIHAVPQSLRHGAYGLGSTKSETIRQVVLPAALPGIVAAVMLAISRAIGETMIVAMAAGLAANLTFNPLAAVTTVTVQIATLLVGDQEFDSPKTLSAFALGLVLFVITLCLNVIALAVVRKYREKYD